MAGRGGWLVAGALAAASVPACGPRTETTAAADAGPRVVPVTVAPLERRTVERTVEVVGTLRGWEEVTVGAKLPATRVERVVRVRHGVGDRVKPGEVLVELDPIDAELSARQAESQYLGELAKLGITSRQADEFVQRYGVSERLIRGEEADKLILETPAVVEKRVQAEKARQNLARQRQLNLRGAGTGQDLQNAENDARGAEAAYENAIGAARTVVANAMASKVALDIARQTQRDMVIRAPTPSALPEGVGADDVTYALTKKSVAEGQMLKQGDAVAELAITSPLKLWANVPERFIADVGVGQPVRVTVAAYPGRVFDGRVARINPAVDATSRTFQVEAVVPNDGDRLRPGGFAKAAIVTRADAGATTAPVEAIVRFAGVTKLFVVEADKARAIPVETGLEGPGWVEVLGDLPDQAQVVTTGQTQLADGTPVRIRQPEVSPVAVRR